MKTFIPALIILLLSVLLLISCSNPNSSSPAAVTRAAPSIAPTDFLFNADWKFHLETPADSNDDHPELAKSNPAFNDASWRTLDLPHDWSIELPFNQNLAAATAYLPGGIGWYRKSFTLPESFQTKQISIRFDGVYKNASVWINGHLLGKRPYGYSTFSYDLTRYLTFGATPNVLAVQVDHTDFADSRWYSGSGIYRNVFLTITNPVHVMGDLTSVSTPQITPQSATLNITTPIQNNSKSQVVVRTTYTVLDPSGHIAYSDENPTPADPSAPRNAVRALALPGSLTPGDDEDFDHTLTIAHPILWSLDHPVLYILLTSLSYKTPEESTWHQADTTVTPFGIRTALFSPATGFSLNGQSLKIKGVCLHEDAGALGSAIPLEVWQRRLQILKEAGVNAIRTSHNPPAPEFLDLCDHMGFLVMDEAFDEWTGGKHKWVSGHNISRPNPPSTAGYHTDFPAWSDIDIRDMVLRDRNHPSIILWSIGNEIDYTNDPFPANSPELAPIAARLIKDVKAVDPTRYVTAACAFPETNLYVGQLDVAGYNYMERFYAADHARAPDRILLGSENSHALAAWQVVDANPYVAGQFLWTGIDYLGEASAWPNRASRAGLLDLAGFPKSQYYFRQSLWSDKPMVYITDQRLPGARRGAGGALPGQQPLSLPGQTPAPTQPNPSPAPPSDDAGLMPEYFPSPAPPQTAEPTTQPAAFPTAGPITITCYTNCESVELFLNGKSLGEKSPPAATRTLTWATPFPTGATLRAVGKNKNKNTNKLESAAACDLQKPGPAARIMAKPYTDPSLERATSLAGAPVPNPRGFVIAPGAFGPGVAQIEVHITDAAGNPVPSDASLITATLTGPARILGIENGDTNSHESYQAPTHHAYQGQLLIYLQSSAQSSAQSPAQSSTLSPQSSPITLTLTAPNLTPITLTLTK